MKQGNNKWQLQARFAAANRNAINKVTLTMENRQYLLNGVTSELGARLFWAYGKAGIALATTLTIPLNIMLIIEVYQCQRIFRAGGDTIATSIT